MVTRLHRGVPIVIAVAAAVIVLLWSTRGPIDPSPAAPEDSPAQAEPPDAPRRDDVPPRGLPRAARPDPPAAGGTEAEPASPEDSVSADEDSEAMDDAMAEAWSRVDLEEVRRAMPDNLYFTLSLPTTDEAVLAERAAERARWNNEYGKILSGTGTEEEIRAYYDQQARLSGDYVEFTTYLLDHYRDTLVPRDVSLLELARRLHLARLEEMPRKAEEARERKRLQDKARAEWLADEEAFARDQADVPNTEDQ